MTGKSILPLGCVVFLALTQTLELFQLVLMRLTKMANMRVRVLPTRQSSLLVLLFSNSSSRRRALPAHLIIYLVRLETLKSVVGHDFEILYANV